MSFPFAFRSQAQIVAFLFIASLTFAIAPSANAQRRAGRGDRGGNAGARDDRYGTGGYGAAGASRDSGGAAQEAPKGPLTYPERTPDAAGGTLAEYQKPTYDHYRFAVSPDGTRLALSGRHLVKDAAANDKAPKSKAAGSGKPAVTAHVVEVIDVASGRAVVAFKPPTFFENLALSPNNAFLAAESTDRTGVVNVLHLPTRKSKEFQTNLRRIVPGGIVFSSDNRSINVLGADRMLTIALASGDTKELKYEFTTPAVSYNAATNMLAAGVSRSSRGKPEVQIFDVAAGKETKQLAVPTAPIRLAFSTDGSRLVAVVAGGILRAWQTSDWTEVESATTKIAIDAGQLAVSPDGNRVAVLPRVPARADSKVIDLSTGDVVETLRALDAFFLPSGVLAVASAKGPFYLDLATSTLAELPPSAGNAALAQSGGGEVYGATSDLSPTGGQPGYGAAAPQPTSQPGYGVVTPEPASGQPPSSPGYGSYSEPAGQTPLAPDPSSGRR
jgi:WD40 repeat protein